MKISEIKLQTNIIQNMLKDDERKLFDDIVLQRILGASKHISMIGEIFILMAFRYKKENLSSKELFHDINIVATFFKQTRGSASYAITNAINIILHYILNVENLLIDDAVKKIEESINNYKNTSIENTNKLIDYAISLSQGFNSILVFDYSSMVDNFICRLASVNDNLTIYIAESRIINGGYPFVNSVLKTNTKVHFIPDAALMFFLRKCDAVYFGAETFYANGTVFNTIGSDIVGLICKEYKIPLYVLTPLIKLDIRSIYDDFKKIDTINNTKHMMKGNGFSSNELKLINFDCPELIPIEPQYINAIITEKGVISSTSIYEISMEYIKYMQGIENEFQIKK